MLNRFKLNTISTNSILATLIVVTIAAIKHGTKLGQIINDVDDKNQMWSKITDFVTIASPRLSSFSKIMPPVFLQDTKSKVFGVKLVE